MDGSAPVRRSFIYRELEAAGARFATIGGVEVAADFGDADGEGEALKILGLADLSPWPRTGFKGTGAMAWLASHGLDIGEAANAAYVQTDGTLAAKLAPGEVLVLESLAGDRGTSARLDAAWSYGTKGCWPVPRRDGVFWFLITGEHAANLFAKICGVDLRPKSFAEHAIAQTSVARSSAIVIRDDIGAIPAYHMLGDSASAAYMWGCLTDAMAEFDGRPVGYEALKAAL